MPVINGDGGDNPLNDTSGDDTINAGGGNDVITVTGGSDTANGDEGNDSLVVNWGAATAGIYNYSGPTFNAAIGGFNGQLYGGSQAFSLDYSSIERFVITTGSGNDAIVTATGNDVANLGGGNDTVNLGTGLDQADGGTGTDGISADQSNATAAISWNLLTNTYSGAAGTAFTNFEYFGTIHTGSGNDTIVTGAGSANETVHTGSGDDTITIHGGLDSVNAGAGFDTLVVDWSAATTAVYNYSGPGPDEAVGGFNGEFYGSSIAYDVYYNSIERFLITTGSGSDSIVTASGNDVVNVGGGDDVVNVGTGLDQADGGAGRDGISANQSAATTAITWNLLTNTYSGAAGTAFTNFEYFGTIHTGSGNDTIVTGAGSANETVHTGSGDDTITIHGGLDTVNAGAGFDTLVVDWGAATTAVYNYSGPSPDGAVGGFNGEFYGSSIAYDVYYNSIERFLVTTGSGNDTIETATGDDVVNVGGGDDGVSVGTGLDQADGGTGRDRISANQSAATAAITWNLLTNTYSGAAGTAFTNFEYFGTIHTGSGNDTIVAGAGSANETVHTGSGDDTITIHGGLDTVNAGAGFDTLVVDWSAATTSVYNYSGPSPDGAVGGFNGEFYGSSIAYDVYYNSIERFVITTGSGNDSIVTATGNDIINGGGGNDTLDGAGGVNTLDGGEGNDRLIVGASGAGSSVSGGAGSDTLSVTGTTWLAALSGIETIELGGSLNFTLTSTQFGNGLPIDAAITGSGNVTVNVDQPDQIVFATAMSIAAGVTFAFNGSSGTDVIKAGHAINTIDGGAGADFLKGGNLADTILGGTERDKIIGWGGADVLTGGAGNDQFRYLFATDSGIGAAADRITDFLAGTDQFDFRFLDSDLATPGVQPYALTFVGTTAFDGSGNAEIRYGTTGADLTVELDLDGDGSADMQIVLAGAGGQTLSSGDFLL